MFYTGMDPFAKQPVYVAHHLRDRKLRRALTKGEPAGERGLPNRGYRPGRKATHRPDRKRKAKRGRT
jgi:hypothetical protein